MGSAPASGGTQAVDRAAALISLVVRADEPLSFTELSDAQRLSQWFRNPTCDVAVNPIKVDVVSCPSPRHRRTSFVTGARGAANAG